MGYELLALLSSLASQGTRVETWPGGGKKAEYETGLDTQGNAVKHGAFRSYFEDGKLESEGAFEDGRESGPWVLHHPDGARAAAGSYADGLRSGPWESFFANGQMESKGAYVRGAMDGRWSFWSADGAKDLAASGMYRLEVYRSSAEGRHYRGYFVDNLRQGTWTSAWPDKTKQLEGRFEAGARTGPWVFSHPDGTPSSLLLSGEYAAGAWIAPLARPDPPPLDRTRLPAVEPGPGGWPGERKALSAALTAAAGSRAVDAELRALLASAGPAAIPVVLERVRVLDPEQEGDRVELAFLADQVLRPLCAGHALSPHTPESPPDARAARELVRAWLSLWALTRLDTTFWEHDVPGTARSSAWPRDLLQDPPLLERDRSYAKDGGGAASGRAVEGAGTSPRPARGGAAAAPADETRSPFRFRSGRAKEERLRFAAAGTKESVARALAWLAAHQHEDGHWSNADFTARCAAHGREECAGPGGPQYDAGATGLALLAFLGDGHTSGSRDHGETVARGLAWLVHSQSDEGRIGSREPHDFLYGHAIATAALCEGFGLGDAALRASAERALVFLQSGRHPEAGWRYDVPATERGDTSVTGWAIGALLAGRHAGLAVDDAALAGALAWIEAMTEPTTGRVGYTNRGELSARDSRNKDFPIHLGEAMTGVGLACRLQLGQKPATTPILIAHAKLLATKPPTLHPEFGGDQVHWYHGTYALHEMGAPFWDAWELELRKVIVLGQQRRGGAEGSWDPLGPWGQAMGRVCATALMALTLEHPYRYPRALEVER